MSIAGGQVRGNEGRLELVSKYGHSSHLRELRPLFTLRGGIYFLPLEACFDGKNAAEVALWVL